MSAAMRDNLLRWQHELYPDGHRDRLNLAVHLVAVPIFQMGAVTIIEGAVRMSGFTVVGGWLAIIVSLAAQGRTHRREATKPIPFDGPLDFVTRIFAEQFVTFPRFVLGGGVMRAWRGAK